MELKLPNPYLKSLKSDVLYHLALGTETHDLPALFGDVKFVCMGGTGSRMKTFAEYLAREINYLQNPAEELYDYSAASHRFSLYKVGPVISVSHGMGFGSVSILLHEIIKLLYYAKCKDPILIRIGTCGGIGVEPGTVIVTNESVDGTLRNEHEFKILDKRVFRKALFDLNLAKEIISFSKPEDNFQAVIGKTLATDDFYEGQGRLDGAICEHSAEEKLQFLNKLYEGGVRNIEMESLVFGAITHYIGIRAADVCVAFINRLNGDQVTTPKNILTDWQLHPQKIVIRYIKEYMFQCGML